MARGGMGAWLPKKSAECGGGVEHAMLVLLRSCCGRGLGALVGMLTVCGLFVLWVWQGFGCSAAVLRCNARLVGRGCLYADWGFACAYGRCGASGGILLPLLLLQDLWAGSSGLFGLAGSTWSAVQGSSTLAGKPHSQQTTAVSRTCLARLR
jgi:hypothetical protein